MSVLTAPVYCLASADVVKNEGGKKLFLQNHVIPLDPLCPPPFFAIMWNVFFFAEVSIPWHKSFLKSPHLNSRQNITQAVKLLSI